MAGQGEKAFVQHNYPAGRLLFCAAGSMGLAGEHQTTLLVSSKRSYMGCMLAWCSKSLESTIVADATSTGGRPSAWREFPIMKKSHKMTLKRNTIQAAVTSHPRAPTARHLSSILIPYSLDPLSGQFLPRAH